ncbi:hypothetical protein RBSWK_03441 [Rhodopirellula baltica SWK14]|uniref:Uncharacterized protein n=1 Tax=Rhodopirellula baltica SWK14 TaxID=993516 RepID=L7CFH6_RHOBT|nr:hypothetical protein RBSWK_03441 [Rhodopirellula baltica SWK14]
MKQISVFDLCFRFALPAEKTIRVTSMTLNETRFCASEFLQSVR